VAPERELRISAVSNRAPRRSLGVVADAQIWTVIAIWAVGLFATLTQMRRMNLRMMVGFAELRQEIREFRDEVAGARADLALPA
jgi:hypothetical protein